MFTVKNYLPSLFILSAPFLSAGDIAFNEIFMDVHDQSWLDPFVWDDDTAPSFENNYFLTDLPDISGVSIMLATQDGQFDSASSNFPGNTLTIPSGTRLQLTQEGTNTASILNGEGDIILDGGEIFFAPPTGNNQPFLQADELFVTSAAGSTITQTPDMDRAQIATILTGPGDLRVTFESPEDSINRSLVFTEVDNYTGIITVEKGIVLDFNTDEFFEGGIELQGSSKLNVDQTLSFPKGALRDPLNGEVPRGLYSGASLNALGANYQDNGGTIIVIGDDTYVALPESFSPANPSEGDLVTWNSGQPNEVTGLTFGTDAFSNVQSAIDAVVAENTVFIDEGDYIAGSTLSIEKDLTLTGDDAETTRLLREETAAPHSILRIGNRTVILNNLTITGGNSSLNFNTGGGIDCQSSDLTLNNCLVTANNCQGQKSGGGIGGASFSLAVNDSTISNNTCAGKTDNGGGIGGRSATITVTNSTIIDNTVTSPTSGGGIGGLDQQITVNNSLMNNNTCQGANSGGALGAVRSSITVNDCTITNNNSASSRSGGGIGGSNVTITVNDSTISNNTSQGGDSGGGIGGSGATITVNDSTISDNTSQGINSGGGLGGRACRITMNRSIISANTSEEESSGGGSGGSISTYFVNDSIVTGNTAVAQDSGGGIGGLRTNITANNSTISGNTATNSRSGGGIGGAFTQNITMTNCTITDNSATSGGIGGRFDANATVTATNCIIAGNTSTGNQSNPDILANTPFTNAGGNIIGIPEGLAIDDIILPLAENGGPTLTHALASNSPAINIGLNNALPTETVTDQRGEGFPRIINNLIDSGAIEADTNFIIDPLDDNDGDGLITLLELAIGTEPNAPDFGSEQLLQIGQSIGTQPFLTFGRGATPLPNTTLIVERSATLQEGSFEQVYRFVFDSETSTITPDSGISEELIGNDLFIITDELNSGGKAFYRLRASLSPN